MVTRPPVTVVMPFAGSREAASVAVARLLTLGASPADQLIVADNSGTVPATPGVEVVAADGERSPAHARNAGAVCARGDWLLFVDADCEPAPGLLEAYFARPIQRDVGALAGEVIGFAGTTVAERYGAARGFLGHRAHRGHPFLPRAVAANLLVRRAVFEELGGFYEGLRAAEDTDFSWRLQRTGWRLEYRPDAIVRHHYRATVRDLRRQWRGYAAGRAWLARRYDGFTPEPALRRASRRARRRLRLAQGARDRSRPVLSSGSIEGQVDGHVEGREHRRASHLALDALLAAEELAGLARSNRPSRDGQPISSPAAVVLIADRFPARDDPLAEFACSLQDARVEAVARPAVVDPAARGLWIEYREDDGVAARAVATVRLLVCHPLRCARDAIGRQPDEAPLSALAPAALRLNREREARVHALGGDGGRRTARRLGALAGHRLPPSG